MYAYKRVATWSVIREDLVLLMYKYTDHFRSK